MKITIKQTNKGLHDATFVINVDGEDIGSVAYKGSVARWMCDIFQITLDNCMSMQTSATELAEQAYCYEAGSKALFPFKTDDTTGTGYVGLASLQTGLFRRKSEFRCNHNGMLFVMHWLGLGKDGIKAPIYLDNDQIGIIRKQAEVENDLHTFEIEIYNVDYNSKAEVATYVYPTIYFTLFQWIRVYYKPGQVTTSGKSVHLFKSKQSDIDKYLKYQ